jgi:hypothetical protein
VQTDEIASRLRRAYAALDATLASDVDSAKPTIEVTETRTSVTQDFSGDQTQADMENVAHTLIHNIANLKDHAKRYLKKRNEAADVVEKFVASVTPVAIIQDLSNNDKHGYPPRDGGYSKVSPKLINVRRVLQVTAGPGASAGITIDPTTGKQQIWGSESTLMVTGDVVDVNGTSLGSLDKIQSNALFAWEQQLHLLRL